MWREWLQEFVGGRFLDHQSHMIIFRLGDIVHFSKALKGVRDGIIVSIEMRHDSNKSLIL